MCFWYDMDGPDEDARAADSVANFQRRPHADLFVYEHCTRLASRTLSSVTQALLETASWANTFVTSSAKGWRPSSIVLQNTFFLNIDQTIRFDIISSRWQHVCAICVRHSWKQWQDIWKSLHRLLERSAAEAVACKFKYRYVSGGPK